MDHDRLFKQLLTTLFAEFVELFLPEVSQFLERDSIHFLDKEVFTDLTSGERHEVDLIAQAKFQGRDTFFLIHVETQSSRETDFSRRMFRYFARLHEKFDLPIYPVALFSYDAPATPEPESYEIAFPNRQVLAFHYHAIQLNRLNWRDFVRQPNPVAAALMTKMKIAPEDRPRVKLECLRLIVTLKLNPARSALIAEFMARYLALSQPEVEVYNEQVALLASPERTEVMAVMNEWVAEAVHKNAKLMAIGLLQRHFGSLTPEFRSAIEQLSIDALNELTLATVDFKDVAEAQAWVAQHAVGQ